jgi:uncharacterized damage-inducible protein DinB
MNQANAKIVESYGAGEDRMAETVRGWTDADLRRLPPESAGPEVGKWSVHQLVIHLQDAELAFADRMRRVIAMDKPALLMWSENAYFTQLKYQEQSTNDGIDLIRLTRRQLSRILRKLSDADFERTGIHSERGPQKLSDIIGFADWHLNHHLGFVAKKRTAFNG